MYVMESEGETERLVLQEDADNAAAILRDTGLGVGAKALDAGCGPGLISQSMLRAVGPTGSLCGFDMSAERVAEASRRNAVRNAQFFQGNILSIDLPDAQFDYTWSQFVLEYLPKRDQALRELIRVTRPGGKIVVSEIDGLGFNNWPFSKSLEEGSKRFIEALSTTGFDLHVGRKLFSEFRKAGLREVKVRLYPQYVIAGEASERMMNDWRTRFQALAPHVAPAFGGAQGYTSFCEEYLAMLANPDGLKYAVLLVTEGTRA